jgi:translation initiation factor IF-2
MARPGHRRRARRRQARPAPCPRADRAGGSPEGPRAGEGARRGPAVEARPGLDGRAVADALAAEHREPVGEAEHAELLPVRAQAPRPGRRRPPARPARTGAPGEVVRPHAGGGPGSRHRAPGASHRSHGAERGGSPRPPPPQPGRPREATARGRVGGRAADRRRGPPHPRHRSVSPEPRSMGGGARARGCARAKYLDSSGRTSTSTPGGSSSGGLCSGPAGCTAVAAGAVGGALASAPSGGTFTP